MSQPDVSVVEPRAAHDDLPFEELARRYNFRQTSLDTRVLARLVIKECERRPRPRWVLDVGCGRGISRSSGLQRAIREHADAYWGIEPDTSLRPDPGIFHEHVVATMEAADLPSASFDVAYSSMVMEHVADPAAFMEAMWNCLKPGGCYLFITPNLRHYFTRAAVLLNRLGLDETVLRLLMRGAAADYHYPLQYRFNDRKHIDPCAQRLGFLPPEYVYLEAVGPLPYFPGPLRVIFHLLAAKRRLLRNPRALLTVVCRITKPAKETVRGDGETP